MSEGYDDYCWGMSLGQDYQEMSNEDYYQRRMYVPRLKMHVKNCTGHEVQRVNHKTEKKFMGCSNFPDCRWSRG